MDIENFKLGALEGYAGVIVIIAVALSALLILTVLIINAVKAVKEHRDDLEDKKENEFFAEYGVTGEEVFLNHKLAVMRNQLKGKGALDDDDMPVARQKEVAEQDETKEPPQEEPVQEPTVEETPADPEPVKEVEQEPVKEEPVKAEPEKEEPIKEVAPEPEKIEEAAADKAEEPVAPAKQGVEKPAAKKVVKKKPDDWSKYDGEYEGYYYDPEDACYYEGTPSPALAKKLAAKQAELEAANANKDKKVIIKKIAPPFAALKTPKNERKTPNKVAGFDEAVIYGKYVIEHVDKKDGSHEYFYTIYDPSGNVLYEGSNYSSLEYCQRAISRLKSHAIIGQYTIEAEGGKFFFVLKRKTYVHRGLPQITFEQANDQMRQFKNYVQTDIVREQ